MYRTVIDQLSRSIVVVDPIRIISLVPSQTELLFDLGLDDEIIAVTKFCVYPAGKVKNKIKTGGTKKLDIGLIRNLKPDLIIGNKEENERGQIEALMKEFPVWMSDIANLTDALGMIEAIGILTSTTYRANAINYEIKAGLYSLSPIKPSLRVAYLIWQQPYMVAGKDTFIDDMLQRCGLVNVFEQARYPEITDADLHKAKPEVVMLSSEPYPFRQKHIEAFKAILPGAKVILVDGEIFSWYGSRLLYAGAYLKELIDDLSQ